MQPDIPSNHQDGEIHHGIEGVHAFEHTGEKEFSILSGSNLGYPTLLLSLPLQEFYDRSFVANSDTLAQSEELRDEPIAQRPLDPRHAHKLGIYILKGLFHAVESYYAARLGRQPGDAFYRLRDVMGTAPYQSLQPITVNLRSCLPGGRDLKFKRYPDGRRTVFLTPAHTLWVLDGQHRREGMWLVSQFLREIQRTRRYPSTPALFPEGLSGEQVPEEDYEVWGEILTYGFGAATVMVETHLGLEPQQQRQLFHDLNNLVKRIDSNLAHDFDQANPVNLYIKERLLDRRILPGDVMDSETAERDIELQPATFRRKDLIAICAILFLGRHNVTGATPKSITQLETYADQFWKLVISLPGFAAPRARSATIAAQPVVLKAIARLFFEFHVGRGKARRKDPEAFRSLVKGLKSGAVDFGHGNRMWRYFMLPEQEREDEFPGLSGYLPEGRTHADLGVYDPNRGTEGLMVFGSRHNDIYPLLADMIRWKLRLPNRRKGDQAA